MERKSYPLGRLFQLRPRRASSTTPRHRCHDCLASGTSARETLPRAASQRPRQSRYASEAAAPRSAGALASRSRRQHTTRNRRVARPGRARLRERVRSATRCCRPSWRVRPSPECQSERLHHLEESPTGGRPTSGAVIAAPLQTVFKTRRSRRALCSRRRRRARYSSRGCAERSEKRRRPASGCAEHYRLTRAAARH